MKRLQKFMKSALLVAVSFSISNIATAQCKTWKDIPQKDEAENAYQIYKDHLKQKNYEAAMVPWQKLISLAPGADGKRISPFWDGINILKEMIDKESDETKKKEFMAKILTLHDQCIECLESKVVTLKNCSDEKCIKDKIADQLARKAEDMYRTLDSSPEDILAVAQKAVKLGGNDISYKVLHPYANSAVKLYVDKKLSAEKTRKIHDKLNEIADINTEMQEDLAEKYKAANDARHEKRARNISQLYTKYKIRMNKDFKQIEDFIFDCQYFKDLYVSDYEENSDDLVTVKTIYAKLKSKGCEETDPLMAELSEKFKALAAAQNAIAQEEFNKNNPAHVAKQLYDNGDYEDAIDKYKEALEKETDPTKQADFQFRIASIQGRKLKQYAQARNSAITAAKLRPNWGRPYLLIADLYAMSSSRCGDDWNQRLAVLAAIEKYSYAKSIDPEVADEASERIGKYLKARPDGSEGHMRGVSEGSKQKCGCWIGETVTVKFK